MEKFQSEITIYEGNYLEHSQNVQFKGHIVVKDNKADGIVKDLAGEQYFIFGTLIKFGDIDLIVLKNNQLLRYRARKGLFTYNGKCEIMTNNDIVTESSFYLEEIGLNYDHRDYGYNPFQDLIDEIENFKKGWLQNSFNSEIYNNYANDETKKKR